MAENARDQAIQQVKNFRWYDMTAPAEIKGQAFYPRGYSLRAYLALLPKETSGGGKSLSPPGPVAIETALYRSPAGITPRDLLEKSHFHQCLQGPDKRPYQRQADHLVHLSSPRSVHETPGWIRQ
jgi:hypothetical protein